MRFTDSQIQILLQSSPKKDQKESHRNMGSYFTQKMTEHQVSTKLQQSAKEIGLYKAGIEQKRDEKEQLLLHKETLTQNINDRKNKTK